MLYHVNIKNLRSKRLAKLEANAQRVSNSDGYNIFIANIQTLTADIMNITAFLCEKPRVLVYRCQSVTGMCWLHLQMSKEKFNLEQATKTQKWSRGIALLFL